MPRRWKDVRAEAWHVRNPGFKLEEDEASAVWVVRAIDTFEVDGITYIPPSFTDIRGLIPGVSVSRPMIQTLPEPMWRTDLEAESE